MNLSPRRAGGGFAQTCKISFVWGRLSTSTILGLGGKPAMATLGLVATRSITTSQPAVNCDVCGRNLLRGELPDVFLAAGERRVVCDLCVGRAANEGWLREGDGESLTLRPPRGRRARTLVGRLRQRREQARADASEPVPWAEEIADEPASFADAYHGAHDAAPPSLAAEPAPAEPQSPSPSPSPPAVRAARAVESSGAWGSARSVHAVPANSEQRAIRALEIFNGGEGPRRVAGVARSLGAPGVTARPLDDSTLVSVVVAWELCWYRYEVDLADEDSGAHVSEQGLELTELAPVDRVVNARADERGELQMLSLEA